VLGVPQANPTVVEADLQAAQALGQTRGKTCQSNGRTLRVTPEAGRLPDRILADFLVP